MSTVTNQYSGAWDDIRQTVEETLYGQSALDIPNLKTAAGISCELTNKALASSRLARYRVPDRLTWRA